VNTHLEIWLQDKFRTASEAAGHSASPSGLRISPPLAQWEAEFLERGLNENLFEVDERGLVGSELLSSGTDAALKSYRILTQEPVRLLRENVCQLGAAARLVFEGGWLRRHVSLEAGRTEHSATADHFELLVRSPGGKIFIWVEARRSAVELNKLIADLRACSRRGPHAHEDCGFQQNHPRHEFCIANHPACLWAVAPEGEMVLAVKCDGATVELEPLSSLPPRSLFELGQA